MSMFDSVSMSRFLSGSSYQSFKIRTSAYFALCKPKVVMLMLVTSVIGMLLAYPTIPNGQFMLFILITNLGIGLCAAAAATINHLIDRRIDALMHRTHDRPLVSGTIKPAHALVFAVLLAVAGSMILLLQVNRLTAWLTLASLVGYAVFYTMFLKRATPQNIVIGGLAGAMPPLLGWTAVTNHVDYQGLLLVLIIFVWTPPHFWVLALYKKDEYAKAGIPMLPVTHGTAFTRLFVLLYIFLLILVTCLPFLVHMSGWIYLVSVSLLNAVFLYWGVKIYLFKEKSDLMRAFRYSILYLFILFFCLLFDRYYFL